MTFWLLADALPLSYRRLVGAKDTTLGSCDKHPAYCQDWNVDREVKHHVYVKREISNASSKEEYIPRILTVL